MNLPHSRASLRLIAVLSVAALASGCAVYPDVYPAEPVVYADPYGGYPGAPVVLAPGQVYYGPGYGPAYGPAYGPVYGPAYAPGYRPVYPGVAPSVNLYGRFGQGRDGRRDGRWDGRREGGRDHRGDARPPAGRDGRGDPGREGRGEAAQTGRWDGRWIDHGDPQRP